eukprot:3017148-Rhodomonas_salina.1
MFQGSMTIGDCLCNAGYTGMDGGPCTACPANMYKSSNGSGGCLVCPAHSHATPGSSDKSKCVCNTGYYAQNDVCESLPWIIADFGLSGVSVESLEAVSRA